MADDLNELVASANHLTAVRDEGRASREDRELEQRLRRRIRRRLTATRCACPCGDGVYECACARCRTWLHNQTELDVLASESAERCGMMVPVALGDVEAFAGVLARLTREGESGANFVVGVARGMDNAYVQFAGSPREKMLLWEAGAVEAHLLDGGDALLRSLGFAGPEDNAGPNYRQERELGDDPDVTLIDATTATFRIYREVYGCPPYTIIDLELHMGAWAD